MLRRTFNSLALALLLASWGCGQDGAPATPPASLMPLGGDHETHTPQNPPGTLDTEDLPNRGDYPLVFLHGALGFIELGPLEYFYGVRAELSQEGHTVYLTQVDPVQRVHVRANQLPEQIDDILVKTGASRVHLIAHSQGGLDARYLISTLGYGDKVATLTTLATPHQGTPLVDMALGTLPGFAQTASAAVVNFLAGSATGADQDLEGQMLDLSVEYVTGTFNLENPNDPQVSYYSVTGVTQANPFVDPQSRDVVDPLFLASYLWLKNNEGDNDGLVPRTSAEWGTFLGEVAADHLDEIGQLAGMTAPAFDYLQFYRNLAIFLTDANAPSPL